MKAVTLYHHPEQGQLHVLISEVEESGAHKVVDSQIIDLAALAFGKEAINIQTEIGWYEHRFGQGQVRAYTCKEERT